ncbi:MAG: MEDS domain-containing protein [Dehalococcoidia bacterium]|nr:MEDS domain-containing protein [Dehalococcoidia bacterium]
MTTQVPRRTGIDVIGDVPWGTHFCQFYETTQDLIDTLVPYFKAGLEDNEFCMWVTSPPLAAKEAEAALRQAVPDLDRYLERGQIEIIPYTDWYVVNGGFDSQRVLDGWVAKVEDAQARGFAGLRLSGNTFWLEKQDWKDFAAYEEEVNNVIGNYNLMAICTYSLEKCGATEIVDVISTHQFALIKREGRWETIESAERRKLAEERNHVRAALKETEERYSLLFEHLNEGFALHEMLYDAEGRPVDYRFLAVNPAFEQLTGLKRDDVVGRTVREVIPGVEQSWIDAYGEVARTGEPRRLEGFAAPLGRYYDALAFSPAKDQFAVLFLDVTERKRWEEEIKSVARFPAENPSPVLRVDKEGILLYANPASEALSPVLRLVVGEPAPAILRSIAEKALSQGLDITINIEAGDKVWSFSVAPIVEAGYANLYGRDITERRRVAEELRQREADLKRAQAVGHVGSWRLDVRRNVLEWSDEAYRMFGVPPGTPLTYETFLGLVHPEDREAVDQAWQAALKGEPYDIDHRIVTESGIKWVREVAELEFDSEGMLRGGFGTCQDITERKRTEEELRRANAVKDDFVGMVSHEMRTPLTAILGVASLLLGPTPLPEEDRRELMEEVRAGAERLSKIIDNLLSLARADTRRPDFSPVEVSAIVEELVDQHCARHAHRQVRKRVDGGAVVVGTREYVLHILSNLLENAEKYTPRDQPIDIDVRRDGGEVVVRVLDRGIGLEPQEMQEVFAPFYRSSRGRAMSSGIGIGLTVCKRLVEGMGGRIWAAPRDGGGSEFGFTLPSA